MLTATAGLARDRGLLADVVQRVSAGADVPRAVVATFAQFSALFTQLGGLMAERVTDLADVRDRLVAELTGQPEPGIPVPEQPSVLLADDLAELRLHERVQARGRLVEEQELDVGGQRGHERDLLPVALGVGRAPAPGVQVEAVQQLVPAGRVQAAPQPSEQVDDLPAGQTGP